MQKKQQITYKINLKKLMMMAGLGIIVTMSFSSKTFAQAGEEISQTAMYNLQRNFSPISQLEAQTVPESSTIISFIPLGCYLLLSAFRRNSK